MQKASPRKASDTINKIEKDPPENSLFERVMQGFEQSIKLEDVPSCTSSYLEHLKALQTSKPGFKKNKTKMFIM